MGAKVLLLTTVGRKSGKSRTIPLLYLAEDSHWAIVASNGGDDRHPAWWLNLKANPAATIQVRRTLKQVRAREASESEQSVLWPRFVKMHSGYQTYQQRTKRKIPVVILEPETHRGISARAELRNFLGAPGGKRLGCVKTASRKAGCYRDTQRPSKYLTIQAESCALTGPQSIICEHQIFASNANRPISPAPSMVSATILPILASSLPMQSIIHLSSNTDV